MHDVRTATSSRWTPVPGCKGITRSALYEDMLWVSENATDAAKKYKMTQDIDMTGKNHPDQFGTNYTEGAREHRSSQANSRRRRPYDQQRHGQSVVHHTPAMRYGATKSGAVIKT